MIGRRAICAAGVTIVGVALALGPGAPRPEIAIEAARLVRERASTATDALAALDEALDAALELGREGAAAVVAGDDPPGPTLLAAGEALTAAMPLAEDASGAMASLESARLAADPAAVPLPAGPDAALIGSIGIQLAGTAKAADTFAAMRHHAADVPVSLEAALAALGRGDPDAAAAHAADARAAHDAVAGWDAGIATLPIWVETAGATIDAVERLVAAVRAGNTAAADAAAADFEELRDPATKADRALAIAISDGAASVVAAPLSRLVDAIDALDAQRAALARIYSEPVP